MYGIELVSLEKLPLADCIIVAVGHQKHLSVGRVDCFRAAFLETESDKAK